MKMMERKKFFSALGLGTVGILFAGISPLKYFIKNDKSDKKINVKINPLAVKRKSIGGKNA